MLDIECIFTIYLFPDERTKQEYEKWPGKSESTAFLIGGLPDMEDNVFKIEKANHLNGMHKFIKTIGKENEAGKSIIWIEYAPNYRQVPVIYCKEIGYQRKGMEPGFYEVFEDCKLYFKKEDILRASNYLSPIDSKYYTGTFREQFIDNFIEGESIFFASW